MLCKLDSFYQPWIPFVTLSCSIEQPSTIVFESSTQHGWNNIGHHGVEGRFHGSTYWWQWTSFQNWFFLKPLAKSLDGPVSEVISSSMTMPLPHVFEPKEWPSVVHFSSWRYPKQKWVEWVVALELRYESMWKKVGIFEAIMSTKCFIERSQNLYFGVAEKWCPKTNTF